MTTGRGWKPAPKWWAGRDTEKETRKHRNMLFKNEIDTDIQLTAVFFFLLCSYFRPFSQEGERSIPAELAAHLRDSRPRLLRRSVQRLERDPNRSKAKQSKAREDPSLKSRLKSCLMFRQALLNHRSARMLPLVAALLLQQKERKDTGFYHWRKEKHQYYNLTVKILRARNIKGTDLLSKADCYVELRLPTASPITRRTKVIDNCSDPEWNETFHFKIHNAVKNTLVLALFDEDVLVSDELTSLVFDVTGLKAGRPLKETFKLKEDGEELDVEFFLEKSSDAPGEVVTNGALVAYPCLRLEGVIKKGENSKLRERGSYQFKLSLPGSYENQLCIPYKPDSDQSEGVPFVFHIGKQMPSELGVELERTVRVHQDGVSSYVEEHHTALGSGTVPLHSLPLGKEVDMTVPLEKGLNADLRVKAEQMKKDLDVRLGYDLCKEEREFLEKRKKLASQTLKKTLRLREDLDKNEVPVVAVLGSGGGIRALTGLYGSMFGLQQLNLLDCVTYLSGVSGSSWCMSMLYQDSEWSCKDLKDAIISAREKICSSKVAAFSSERLKYYFQELNAMENDGRKVSFTDLWGLIVEYFLQMKDHQSKLSDQQETVKQAQNPYPIYAAVNVMPNISGDEFAEWIEFTPFEVGFRKYGAFVRTEDFDSEFFMGRLMKRHPEPRICYLQGIWGSAFAASLDDVFLKVVGSGLTFLESLGDVIKVIDDRRRFHFRDPMRLKTRMVIPGGPVLQFFQDFFKSRFTAGETFNFMQGLYLHKDYVSLKNFVAWKGTHLDAFPNRLTPMEDSLYLVDGGFSINSPFPLMLQPERDVDVILSFNYSWEAPFQVLELTQKYCEERDIPFPRINVSKEDEENPKECYLFMNAENPKVPIVLHFPLINDTFCRYKAPGIERESEEEKLLGNFEVEAKDSPYRTLNFTYESHEFDRLINLSCYNVLNNKDALLDALRLGLSRRKLKKKDMSAFMKTGHK
ncbi:cytosolic phospholipase A2 zeta [Anolis carolinensis]|uniref:cytosolic phospholipase A2 zeta n=1 Tax=Anolis carolinensis TaxID=28377 RepID=UPI002F2B774E